MDVSGVFMYQRRFRKIALYQISPLHIRWGDVFILTVRVGSQAECTEICAVSVSSCYKDVVHVKMRRCVQRNILSGSAGREH